MEQFQHFDIDLLGILNFRALHISVYKQLALNTSGMAVSDVHAVITT